MDKEFLEAYDHDGKLIEVAERKNLFAKIKRYSKKQGDANLAVRVIHLFLMNKLGELYIVQRGKKDENPFLYDKTLGAHVVRGETYDIGLQRECHEEFELAVTIVEPANYEWVIEKTNLQEKAVIKKIALDPWYRSVREVKIGEPWIKRHIVQNYIGMFEGELTYLDGEAINVKKITVGDLEKEIKSQPKIFTHDLADLVVKYKPYLMKPDFI